MFTGGGNGPYYGLELKNDTPESIEYVQAALSYWLTEELVSCRTSVFRGDYYSHGKQFVAELPIRRINFSDKGETALHNEITAAVRRLNELVLKKDSSTSKADVELLDRAIDASTLALEEKMDTLYGVTPALKEAVHK